MPLVHRSPSESLSSIYCRGCDSVQFGGDLAMRRGTLSTGTTIQMFVPTSRPMSCSLKTYSPSFHPNHGWIGESIGGGGHCCCVTSWSSAWCLVACSAALLPNRILSHDRRCSALVLFTLCLFRYSERRL